MDPTFVINCLKTGNIQLLDIDSLSMCRTCTAPATTDFRDIFESTGVLRKKPSLEIYKIYEIVEILTGKPVAPTDGLPQSICRACEKQFYTTFNFLNQVERVDVAFRKYATNRSGTTEEEGTEEEEQLIVYSLSDVDHEEVHTTEDSSVVPVTREEVIPRTGTKTAAAPAEKSTKKKSPSKAPEKRRTQKRTSQIAPSASAVLKMDDPKKFQCLECDKSYSLVQALNRHRKAAHSEEKDNKSCPHCVKTFTRADSLALHMRTHNSERPFSCETCGKCFKRRSELREHILTHTKAISYKCKVCEKELTTRMGIFNHTKKHLEGEKQIDLR